jgi:hypothetical protein
MVTRKYDGEIIEYIGDKDARFLIRTKGEKTLICLGLNPSIANDVYSDPTILKVERLAKINGFDSIAMINLSPIRETKSDLLPREIDSQIFNKNIEIIRKTFHCTKAKTILIACSGKIKNREYLMKSFREIVCLIKELKIEIMCIKVNKDGSPMHPCYAKYGKFEKFELDKFYSLTLCGGR